jgi:hypothetical protein
MDRMKILAGAGLVPKRSTESAVVEGASPVGLSVDGSATESSTSAVGASVGVVQPRRSRVVRSIQAP